MTDLPSIDDIVDEELWCDHQDPEIRYKLDSLGRRVYVRQCVGCGAQVGNFIKHSEIDNPDDVPQFDERLRLGWWELRRSKYKQIANERRRQDKQAWFEDYSEYLKSEEWERRRLAVLARDNHRCKARYPGCFGKASMAHHLNYDHVGNEPLFDLVSVCSKCHDILHPEND